jgi:hypothetical protein
VAPNTAIQVFAETAVTDLSSAGVVCGRLLLADAAPSIVV